MPSQGKAYTDQALQYSLKLLGLFSRLNIGHDSPLPNSVVNDCDKCFARYWRDLLVRKGLSYLTTLAALFQPCVGEAGIN